MKRQASPLLDELYRQEIAEARNGLRHYVSRKAAAWYLGVHHTNLSKMRSKGVGPPALVPNPGAGRNSRKLYTLADLDQWIGERKLAGNGSCPALAQLIELRVREESLRLASASREVASHVARLKKRVFE